MATGVCGLHQPAPSPAMGGPRPEVDRATLQLRILQENIVMERIQRFYLAISFHVQLVSNNKSKDILS